jgi:hypothetical protein
MGPRASLRRSQAKRCTLSRENDHPPDLARLRSERESGLGENASL